MRRSSAKDTLSGAFQAEPRGRYELAWKLLFCSEEELPPALPEEAKRIMSIGDYCEKPAATVRGEDTVRSAARRMGQEGLGALVVVTDERPTGIVTDRDLALETLSRRLDPGSVRVDEVASGPLVSVEQGARVRDAIIRVRRHAVRRLPVVDDKQELVGMVATDDLLSLVASELNGLAAAIRSQSRSGESRPIAPTSAVSEHYRKDVATIAGGANVREAADAMRRGAVGSLVVEQDGTPVGIVTDRDLLVRVVAEGRDAGDTRVADIMSQPLRVAAPEDPLDRIVDLMAEQGIRRVPVVRDGELVGIVALDDLLAGLSDELHEISESVRREVTLAQRNARARELARDAGDRLSDLRGQLEHLGSETKSRLLRELEGLRERLRGRDR